MESTGKRTKRTYAAYLLDGSFSDESDADPTHSHRTPQRERKMRWTAPEDAILTECVEKQQSAENIDWTMIASKIRKRDSKQCRERWVEYLNPAISRSPFTDEEDAALEQLQSEHGNHWKLIHELLAERFPRRSATAIKARWNLLLHRRSRVSIGTANESIVAARLKSTKQYQESSQPSETMQLLPIPAALSGRVNTPSCGDRCHHPSMGIGYVMTPCALSSIVRTSVDLHMHHKQQSMRSHERTTPCQSDALSSNNLNQIKKEMLSQLHQQHQMQQRKHCYQMQEESYPLNPSYSPHPFYPTPQYHGQHSSSYYPEHPTYSEFNAADSTYYQTRLKK